MNDWASMAMNHFSNEHLNKDLNKSSGMWPNKVSQTIRFKTMLQLGDFKKKSVLDVGCGLGDFYDFCCKNHNKPFSYTGIELHPEIYKLAKEKYPNLKILNEDIIEMKLLTDSFDYVVASGLFNFNIEDWEIIVKSIIGKLFDISAIGVGVNFLRWRPEGRNPASAYVKAANLCEYAEELTNSFVIRADYKKNDYTLFIYKKQLI